MSAFEQEKELTAILKFFEIFGLQYFSLHKLNYKNANKSPSKFRAAYFIFISFLFGTSWLLIDNILTKTRNKKTTEVTNKNMLSAVMYIIIKILMGVNYLAIFLEGFTSARETKKFFINTREISQLFCEMNCQALQFKSVKKILVSIFLFLSIHTITSCLNGIYLHADELSNIMFTGYLNFFLVLGTFRLFCTVAIINQQLKQFKVSIENISSYQIMRKSFSTKIVSSRFSDDQAYTVKNLRRARIIYVKILENTNISNSSNRWTMLLYVILTILHLITLSYKMVLIVKGTIPLTHKTFYNLFIRLSWLTMIVIHCQQTNTLVIKETFKAILYNSFAISFRNLILLSQF